MTTKNTIIPIAGGKGGVGKSLLATNISIALAQLGHRTIVVDLDLGGSNLHMLLGLNNNHPGIGDYLNGFVKNFENLCIQTEWPHLKYIPGDGTTPFLANLSFTAKNKIIDNIKELDAEYIILDLGAGTAYNTLDFFNIVDRGMVVTSADRIAVMNLLSFLKNNLIRNIERSLKKNSQARITVQEMFSRPTGQGKITVGALIDMLKNSDNDAVNQIWKICNEHKPRIVYNMVHSLQDLNLATAISNSSKKVLSMEPCHIGTVFVDQKVLESVRRCVPLMKYAPNSIAAKCIFTLAGEITQVWKNDTELSDQNLKTKSRELLNSISKDS